MFIAQAMRSEGNSFMLWIPLILCLVSGLGKFVVFAHQNLTREIARISLFMATNNPGINKTEWAALHACLIPDNILPTHIVSKVSTIGFIITSVFFWGWVNAGLALLAYYLFSFALWTVYPFVFPRYYRYVLSNIRKYLETDFIHLTPEIARTQTRVDVIYEVIDKALSENLNLGRWYAKMSRDAAK